MLRTKQIAFLLCGLCALSAPVSGAPAPDGGETHPLPGPGLSYGGIPYGSVSGNVAEYFQNAPPSDQSAQHDVDYSPIEQYLR